MPSAEDVKAELAQKAQGGDFVQRLAERVGASARASTVFGEPVERERVTVIPVARATWGFGGGSGSDAGQQGSGGGGGGLVSPLGYIEVRDDGADFKPLRDPRIGVLRAAVAGGIVGLLLRRGR